MAQQQLNKNLGQNTVQFHLQHTLPDLKSIVPKPSLPHRADIDGTGGTPNQKAERLANRIAFHHFVEPDAVKGKQATKETIQFFKGQLQTGHQCIGDADEALTPSHGPIWLRAVMSLRITSNALARTHGAPYDELEMRVLEWIRHHTSLNRLGEVLGGRHLGKVLLPGARSNDAPCVEPSQAGGQDGKYPADLLTDQVTNIVHQLIMSGAVPWTLGRNFWILRMDAQDVAGAVLARSIVDAKIGFGPAQQPELPPLRSRMLVYRLPDGHWATFPDLMPCALDPGYHAWARYSTSELCRLKKPVIDPPFPAPLPEPVAVSAAPRDTENCQASERPGRPGGGGPLPA